MREEDGDYDLESSYSRNALLRTNEYSHCHLFVRLVRLIKSGHLSALRGKDVNHAEVQPQL